jgi:hypothetical protein
MKAITGATLIDGSGGPPISDAIVLIEGDRIEAAGSSDSVIVPQNSETIDGSGMTLLPGLIDCHDHLASFSYEIASRWGITESRSLRHMRITAVLRQAGGWVQRRHRRRPDSRPETLGRTGIYHTNRRHGRPHQSSGAQASLGSGFRHSVGCRRWTRRHAFQS